MQEFKIQRRLVSFSFHQQSTSRRVETVLYYDKNNKNTYNLITHHVDHALCSSWVDDHQYRPDPALGEHGDAVQPPEPIPPRYYWILTILLLLRRKPPSHGQS